MNNKFKPEEVPDWVRWIAVDKNGECWGFENKPKISLGFPSMWDVYMAGNTSKLYHGEPPKDWRDELYTWK